MLYSVGWNYKYNLHKVHHPKKAAEEGNRGSVSALSAGAYATTLLAMVDTVKGGGRAPPTLTRLG